jgi:hypothetical protein
MVSYLYLLSYPLKLLLNSIVLCFNLVKIITPLLSTATMSTTTLATGNVLGTLCLTTPQIPLIAGISTVSAV